MDPISQLHDTYFRHALCRAIQTRVLKEQYFVFCFIFTTAHEQKTTMQLAFFKTKIDE